MRALLTIGEAAKLVGVTPKAIRHYHKLGLLAEPERSEGGYRLYSGEDLLRLARIRKLKTLGLSLKQVQDVLGEPDGERPLRQVLEALLGELSRKIDRMEQQRKKIKEVLAREDPYPTTDPPGKPYALELAEEHLAEHLSRLDPDVLEQETKMWASLEDFEWPEGYREMQETLVRYYAEHPEECRAMLAIEERFIALAGEPEDSAEVGRLAREFVRQNRRSSLLDEMSGVVPWADGPVWNAFADLMTVHWSPAQRRFLKLVEELSGEDLA